jgi:hypothetical protein
MVLALVACALPQLPSLDVGPTPEEPQAACPPFSGLRAGAQWTWAQGDARTGRSMRFSIPATIDDPDGHRVVVQGEGTTWGDGTEDHWLFEEQVWRCDATGAVLEQELTAFGYTANGRDYQGGTDCQYGVGLMLPLDIAPGAAWTATLSGACEYAGGFVDDVDQLMAFQARETELLQVPAGVFEALPVQAEGPDGTTTLWLNPAAGLLDDGTGQLVEWTP